MTDVAAEAGAMVQKFKTHVDAMASLLNVEVTALAWTLVAKVMAEEIPTQFAVGSLSWKDKPTKSEVIIPVQNGPSFTLNVGNLPPKKAKDFIGKVSKQYHQGFGKPVIKGPKPEERARRYEDLLARQIGKWSRRDGNVTYTCVEEPNGDVRPVFFKLKRDDNGEIKKVKFSSIVSDWKHIP